MSQPNNPAVGRRSPLAGIVVVEAVAASAPAPLAYAAGLCGRMAADLGATVHCLRAFHTGEDPATRMFLHPGKQMHDRDDAGLELIAGADAAVIDSSTHDVLTGQLGAAVPIVLAMASDAPQSGSEFTVEARAGLLDLVGDPAREPLRLGGHQTAYAGGLAAYLGLIAALGRRRAGLPAGPVRVDLLDVAIWLNWKTLSIAEYTGKAPSRSGANAEWAVVPCADGHAVLVYRAQEWPVLMEATADIRLRDAAFQTPAGRHQARPALNAILAEIFAPMTRAEIRAFSLMHKLPLGPVWRPDELRDDPHMKARGVFDPRGPDPSRPAVPILPVRWDGQAFPPATAHAAAG